MLQSLLHWMKQSNIAPTIQKGMMKSVIRIIAGKVAVITSIMKFTMEKKKYWMKVAML